MPKMPAKADWDWFEFTAKSGAKFKAQRNLRTIHFVDWRETYLRDTVLGTIELIAYHQAVINPTLTHPITDYQSVQPDCLWLDC